MPIPPGLRASSDFHKLWSSRLEYLDFLESSGSLVRNSWVPAAGPESGIGRTGPHIQLWFTWKFPLRAPSANPTLELGLQSFRSQTLLQLKTILLYDAHFERAALSPPLESPFLSL